MKKSWFLILPLSLLADSFTDFEKELFKDDGSEVSVDSSLFTLTEDELKEQNANKALVNEGPKELISSEVIAKTSDVKVIEQDFQAPKDTRLRFTIGGDFLYLKPYFSNVPYLIVNDLTNYGSSGPKTAYSTIKNQKFDGDMGFDVFSSLQTRWIDSIIYASWAQFHTKSHQTTYNITNFGPANAGNPTPVAIQYVWNSDITEPYNASAADGLQSFTAQALGYSRLNLDWIDLMIKFPYQTKKRMMLIPGVGVKGFLFEYKSIIDRFKNYSGSSPATSPPYNENKTLLKQRFNAVGPMLALDSSVDLGSNFAFAVDVDAAFVFGKLKTKNNQNLINPGAIAPSEDSTIPTTLNMYESSNVFKALVDLRIGFNWEKQWKSAGLKIQTGYDFRYMPNLMQLISGQTNTVHRSDLSIQGLFAGGALEF